MKKIAYYITAHGYGHGTRSCDILNALRDLAPYLPIIVKTDLPRAFFSGRIDDSIDLRSGAYDVGLVQKDSIQVDLDASIESIHSLARRESELVAQEVAFIKQENVGVVVADIPAIPLQAAQQVGIANIATGNFGWDWIYAEFSDHDPRWQIHADKLRRVYERTNLLLRMPFAEPMQAFPRRIDLPLLARPGSNRRAELARLTGADVSKQWVLLSFTTLNLNGQALENLAQLADYEFFAVEPLQWPGSSVHTITRAHVSFSDTLASMDLVVTKPGFGIVSECIANNKPIIYADRENFREYPVLVENIERYCRNAFIASADLYAGRLKRALQHAAVVAVPPAEMPRGGAEIAAQVILDQLGRDG
ncbi:hypothetical protein G8764_03485 [Pseudomaricurvus alcaniphilus]|uniref:hypothetical protein n=1 Tax=Pseudomaricurvus alcaniphilus TaxID=1166482 RepID=UPI001407D0BE|nr:hypothetical protein [Pseudomaricurvus alcaniphilus]NHN36349.1 hypothetical protein [Pseudomaricurvus alcaniphilus]